jgi:hypothetical protein
MRRKFMYACKLRNGKIIVTWIGRKMSMKSEEKKKKKGLKSMNKLIDLVE